MASHLPGAEFYDYTGIYLPPFGERPIPHRVDQYRYTLWVYNDKITKEFSSTVAEQPAFFLKYLQTHHPTSPFIYYLIQILRLKRRIAIAEAIPYFQRP